MSAVPEPSASSALRLHRALVEYFPDIVVLTDRQGQSSFVSASLSRLTGIPVDQLLHRDLTQLAHPDDIALLHGPVPASQTVRTARFPTADGGWHWIDFHIEDLPATSDLDGYLVVGRDVNDRVATEQALQRQQRATALLAGVSNRLAVGIDPADEALRSIASDLVEFLGASMSTIWHLDAETGRLIPTVAIRHEPPLEEIGALSLAEMLERAPLLREGQVVVEYRGAEHGSPLIALIEAPGLPQIKTLAVVPIAYGGRLYGMLIVTSWHPLVLDATAVTALRSVSEVISASLAKSDADESLLRRATTDDLTGLVNRSALRDRLDEVIATPSGREEGVLVALFDLDDFKVVNDTLGHACGDELLCCVASRLTDLMRPDDTLARLGGDEFVLMVRNSGEQALAAIQRSLNDAFAMPFALRDQSIRLSASIGLSGTDPLDPTSMSGQELLRRADIAMYRAKQGGRSGHGVTIAAYDTELEQAAFGSIALVEDLRRAITGNQLTIALQPIVELDSEAVAGAEALVRWNHPERGNIPPDLFIATAERHGLIGAIGDIVLDKSAAALRNLLDCGALPHAGFVTVNIAGSQLCDAAFVDRLWEVLDTYSLVPSQLRLELTESMLVDQRTRDRLVQLRSMGFKLSIDDFGTGYSSLSYARDLPAETLKLDRSFVNGIATDRRDQALAAAVITMAHALGMRVVAEGVEEPAQRDMLRTLRCDRAQGFYFARPMPLEVLRVWLHGRNGTQCLLCGPEAPAESCCA